MPATRMCGYLEEPCTAVAAWEIGDSGKHPAETWDACELHVWALLTDAQEHWIEEIDGSIRYEVKRDGGG